MDELKKYFQKHEPDLQAEVPDEDRIWERIQLHGQKRNRSKKALVLTLRFAAAACVLLLAGLGVRQLVQEQQKKILPTEITRNVTPATNSRTESPPSPGVAAKAEAKHKPVRQIQTAVKEESKDNDYTQLINYQLNRLRRTPVYAETPEYFTVFKLQLQQMDEDEAMLKKDLEAYGLSDQLLDGLTNIYEQKLHLLKTLQKEIHKMNKKVKEHSNEALPAYYLNI